MSTIAQEISLLRNSIKEVDDDSKYRDSYLYSMWSVARADILYRTLGNKIFITPWAYHRFCIELEKVKSHNCDCVAVGCDVLRSRYKVPKPVSGRFNDALEIQDLDGDVIGITTEQALKSDQLDKIKKGKVRATVYNGYIYIWNTLDLKAIQVNGIWEDVSKWDSIQLCTDDIPCFDIYNLDAGISANLRGVVLARTMELLNIPISRKDDDRSDRNPEIR